MKQTPARKPNTPITKEIADLIVEYLKGNDCLRVKPMYTFYCYSAVTNDFSYPLHLARAVNKDGKKLSIILMDGRCSNGNGTTPYVTELWSYQWIGIGEEDKLRESALVENEITHELDCDDFDDYDEDEFPE